MGKTAFGFVEEGKVIRKGFGEFEDRVIGEVNSTAEEASAYFEERFSKLEDEVNTIAQKIEENANKGSFLTKVEFLKDSLKDVDALGDFSSLEEKLNGMLKDLNTYIEQNRHKNLQIKTALLEQLKPVAESHEWKTASAEVKEIQQKWIKTGAVASDQKEKIEGEFKLLIDEFYKRRDEFYADINKMMEEREIDYKIFIEASKSLLEIKDLQKLREAIHKHQEEWKTLGKIKPKSHSYFWAQFQEVIKKALAEARKKAKKVSGGNSKEQLEKLKTFSQKIEEANKELSSKIDLDQTRSEWRLLQKIKHKDAGEIKQSIRFNLEMLAEKSFINSLVEKKKGDQKDLRFKQKICRDLLERDRRELITFEENMGKFNLAGGLDNMLTKKLKQQEQKVEIKKAILKQIKEKAG